MGFWEHFPYTNFHEMNDSWILKEIKNIAERLDGFTAANKLVYKGVWKISDAYPAWSVVTDNGKLYVSNASVNSGTTLDSEKWIFGGDLVPTEQELNAIIARLNAVEAETSREIEEFKNEIKNDVNRAVFDMSHVAWFGDSYTWGSGSESGRGWQYYLAEMFPGSTFEGLGNGGGGFARDGYYPYTFAGLVDYAITENYITNPETVTTVLLVGGVNDGYDYEAIRNGCNDFINRCKQRFPHAEIIIASNPAPKCFSSVPARVANEVCANSGAHYVADSAYFNLTADDRYNSGDEIHLNDAGYKNVARMLAEFCNGRSPTFIETVRRETDNGIACRIAATNKGFIFDVWGQVASTLDDNVLTNMVMPISAKAYNSAKSVIIVASGSAGFQPVILNTSLMRLQSVEHSSVGSYYSYATSNIIPYSELASDF